MKNTLKLLILTLTIFSYFIIPIAKSDAAEVQVADKKVYTIYLKGTGADAGIVISDLSKEDFHGMACLKGIGIVDYTKGVVVRIPIESIAMIIEYKNEEALNEAANQFEQGMDPLEQDEANDSKPSNDKPTSD